MAVRPLRSPKFLLIPLWVSPTVLCHSRLSRHLPKGMYCVYCLYHESFLALLILWHVSTFQFILFKSSCPVVCVKLH